MIRGVHTMFYTSEPEALRAFLRDSLGLTGFDVGGGWRTSFRAPGDFTIELYEPSYVKS